jgi:hypothetical protein
VNCTRCNAGLDPETGIYEARDEDTVRVCPTCAGELTVLTVFDRAAS